MEQIRPLFAQSANIVFGADNNFFLPLVVCLQSLICNSSDAHNYDIVILSQNFNDQYITMLAGMVEGKNNMSIRLYNVSSLVEKYNMDSLETGHRLSSAAYYRLLIPSVMEEYHKILYLDGDTVILEDIHDLFSHDLKNLYAGVVTDFNIIADMSTSFKRYVEEVLGLADSSRYFNSGVLLLNLDRMREDFPLPFLMEQAALKGKKHHDQDVLNSLFYGQTLLLPPRWNAMWLNADLYSKIPEGREALEHPAIIHFSGGGKPWFRGGAEHPAARYFWKYAEICPYREEIKKVYQQSCESARQHYGKSLRKYYWYSMLSFLLWGRKRRHYKKKRAALKAFLATTKEMSYP